VQGGRERGIGRAAGRAGRARERRGLWPSDFRCQLLGEHTVSESPQLMAIAEWRRPCAIPCDITSRIAPHPTAPNLAPPPEMLRRRALRRDSSVAAASAAASASFCSCNDTARFSIWSVRDARLRSLLAKLSAVAAASNPIRPLPPPVQTPRGANA